MCSYLSFCLPRDGFQIIEKLGGQLHQTANFVPLCTHLVINSLLRNEKYLAACASGRWVLRLSFISASEKAGMKETAKRRSKRMWRKAMWDLTRSLHIHISWGLIFTRTTFIHFFQMLISAISLWFRLLCGWGASRVDTRNRKQKSHWACQRSAALAPTP